MRGDVWASQGWLRFPRREGDAWLGGRDLSE